MFARLLKTVLWILVLTFSTQPIIAGTFKITRVTYQFITETDTGWAETVIAFAKYEGEVDVLDDEWNINTSLNDSWDGSLDHWGFPDHNGNGNCCGEVTAGMTISCDRSNRCSPEPTIAKPDCSTGTKIYIKGRGIVAIPHPSGPEIDYGTLAPKEIPCFDPCATLRTGQTDLPLEASCFPGSDPEPIPEEEACTIHPESCTPILIDLSHDGFRLVDSASGVYFDIDGDTLAEKVSWTDPSHEDAFLALDRNGNGRIDDGKELFGAVSPQLPSDAPNGFEALALFDMPLYGGTGDRKISAEDAIFHQLLLWKDANHDGVSQVSELTPLASTEVRYIDLNYVKSSRRDPHGNLFRWASQVSFGLARPLAAVDVILQGGDESSSAVGSTLGGR